MVVTADVQPGDIFVVDPRGHVGGGTTQGGLFTWIERGERLIDDAKLDKHPEAAAAWGHAGIASRRLLNGKLMIVEAEPHGAVEREWHWESAPHMWSTGILKPCPDAALAALRYAGYVMKPPWGWTQDFPGVGYSFLDYVAIGLHSYSIPAPGLKHYIGTTRHMICSQLADQCRQDGGSHLFDDQRWPGYVTPLDLGLLLQGVQ